MRNARTEAVAVSSSMAATLLFVLALVAYGRDGPTRLFAVAERIEG